ncbi:GL16794 [Drosophila persimilis]|uniref:GL16794 n=1 Tax=Drosophila persimilis TaxID=7234 RepID=B4GI99_DROPE|nr:GL16794 [Drosophila persimilis]
MWNTRCQRHEFMFMLLCRAKKQWSNSNPTLALAGNYGYDSIPTTGTGAGTSTSTSTARGSGSSGSVPSSQQPVSLCSALASSRRESTTESPRSLGPQPRQPFAVRAL